MCEYCRRNKKKAILDDEELKLKIKKEKVLGEALFIEYQKRNVGVHINYCPICGRKLGNFETKAEAEKRSNE